MQPMKMSLKKIDKIKIAPNPVRIREALDVSKNPAIAPYTGKIYIAGLTIPPV